MATYSISLTNNTSHTLYIGYQTSGGTWLAKVVEVGATEKYTSSSTSLRSFYIGTSLDSDEYKASPIQTYANTADGQTSAEILALTPKDMERTTYLLDKSTTSPDIKETVHRMEPHFGLRDYDRVVIAVDKDSTPTKTYSKVTKNLTNCTITSIKDSEGNTLTENTIEVNSTITLELTPNQGYQWSSNPTIGDGLGTIATATYQDKTGVATASFNAPSELDINGKCEEIPKVITYAKVTQALSNCAITLVTDKDGKTITVDTIPVGESFSMTLKPNTNYKWGDTLPSISDGLSTIATATRVYGTTNVQFSDVTATSEMTIQGTTVLDTIRVQSTLTYCTETHTPTDLVKGDTLNVTFTANNGYYFKDTPVIRYNLATGYKDVDCTISDDGLTATGSLDTSQLEYDLQYITLSGVATILPSIPTVTNSLIKAYRISQDGLEQLATKRWNVTTSEGTQTIDLAYYITSLKKFFFNVKTSLDTTLVLYTYDTGIQASIVASDVVTLDCGTITLESTNENNNDYNNTVVQIMLPFIGINTLDSSVIGKTIHLVYDVSTISGDCVAKIYVDDYLMYEYSGNSSEDVPYILNNIQWQLQGSVSFNSSSLYGLSPFITIEYHDNYNDNNQLVINDEKRARLDTLTGLNYVTDVVIDDMTIDDETRTLITSTLEDGVIF